MPTVYTLGYERRPLADLIRTLRAAGVDGVIDIRLRNTSQLAGYTKKDDLAFLLREGFGFAYEHHPELAPTDELLDSYHSRHDWAEYEACFRTLLAKRRAQKVGRDILARYHAPCLFCHEASPDRCHRRLLAEWWAKRIPDLTVVHL